VFEVVLTPRSGLDCMLADRGFTGYLHIPNRDINRFYQKCWAGSETTEFAADESNYIINK
jgi:predicted aspartyl protease